MGNALGVNELQIQPEGLQCAALMDGQLLYGQSYLLQINLD